MNPQLLLVIHIFDQVINIYKTAMLATQDFIFIRLNIRLHIGHQFSWHIIFALNLFQNTLVNNHRSFVLTVVFVATHKLTILLVHQLRVLINSNITLASFLLRNDLSECSMLDVVCDFGSLR